MTDTKTESILPRTRSPVRIARGLWRRTLGRFLRRIDFVIMRRDLGESDVELPEGRDSPMHEGEAFYLEHGTPAHVRRVERSGVFGPVKLRHLEHCADDPRVDWIVRLRDDGEPWCYMMHADYAREDPEYGFVLPIVEGRDILQFDGWVSPRHRGLLIGIHGTNWGNQIRRAEGFERLYAAVRVSDKRSLRLHDRMKFRVVGELAHWRVGPFKFNRQHWYPGEHPQDEPFQANEPARLLVIRDQQEAPRPAPTQDLAELRAEADARREQGDYAPSN